MSDMVEKVARAIDPEAFDLPRDTRGAAQKWRLRTAKARKLARAAIEAMREPTEAMCRTGESSKGASSPESWVDGSYTPENVELIWKDMIDAALKGEAE